MTYRSVATGGLGYGWSSFITLKNLTHFFKSDTCLVEAEVTVHETAKGPCDSGENNTPMEAEVIIHKNMQRDQVTQTYKAL